MRTLLAVLLLAPALVLAQTAPAPAAPAKPPAKKAEVYKWVDDKGVVHYTDKPPTEHATPAALPPLQTYKRGTTPDLNRFTPPDHSGPGAGGGFGPQIQVVTPSREETFHGGDRTVPVAVLVTPSLSQDQQLVYLLDGKAVGVPTSDTSFALTAVDRGEHTVSVTVVDGAGQELSRSPPVTFYMRQPGVKKQ